MTTTIQELIESGRATIVRRCYIKRRNLTTFLFESDWYRIDIDPDTQASLVINWGSCEIGIDSSPTNIGQFNIGNLNMVFNNINAKFNSQTNEQSFWYGYEVRQYSQLKVEAAYIDVDGTEVGTDVIFQGVISKVTLNTDFTAGINILSNQYIVERYDISQLQGTVLTGTMTCTGIIAAIIGDTTHSDIGKYLNLATNVQGVAGSAITIANTQLSTVLSGSVWSVMCNIAKMCGSVIYVVGSNIYFESRTADVTVSYDFRGVGTNNPNITAIKSYDDEGGASAREYWLETSTNTSVIEPSGSEYYQRYLGRPETLNLSIINSSTQIARVLAHYLSVWRKPKPIMEFNTKMLINLINPTNTISIEVNTGSYPTGKSTKWNQGSTWNDGSVWSKQVGPFSELSSQNWMVTRIFKDIQNLQYTITAEKQI